MSIKNDILNYSNMLDRVQKSLETFTFESVEEKALLTKLLQEKLKTLHEKDEYVNYWNAVVDRQLKEDPDYEDPRL